MSLRHACKRTRMSPNMCESNSMCIFASLQSMCRYAKLCTDTYFVVSIVCLRAKYHLFFCLCVVAHLLVLPLIRTVAIELHPRLISVRYWFGAWNLHSSNHRFIWAECRRKYGTSNGTMETRSPYKLQHTADGIHNIIYILYVHKSTLMYAWKHS